MARKSLSFGALLSDLLVNANSNFQELYKAISGIQEDMSDGSVKAIVYPGIDSMIEGLNNNKMADGVTDIPLGVGGNIYVIEGGAPDFWITAKNATSVTDTAAPEIWEKGAEYTFGYYTITVGNEDIVSLVGYQTEANMTNNITGLTADEKREKYASVEAIIKYISDLGYLTTSAAGNTYLTKNEAENEYLTKNDAEDAYATKGDLENAGKVKGVSVNGHEVALDANGIAPITIDDIESGFTACTTFETITVNETNYYAIKVDVAVPALEVYNSSKQQIMTQSVVQEDEDGDVYMYYCIGTSDPSGSTYYLRQLNGSTVNIDSGSGSGSVDLSNYYTKSEVDSKISSSGGGSGVTITSVKSGAPTDVTVDGTSYTNTPVTFKYSDSSSQTIDVKAKNGSGQELLFETVDLTLDKVTVPMETVASLNGYKTAYMIDGSQITDFDEFMQITGTTLELRILVSITDPTTESPMTLGRFVLYPNGTDVNEGFGVIRGLTEGNTTYNIGTCYLNGSYLYFCEPQESNNGSIVGEWPSSDSSWSVTGPDGTEYTTTNCEFKIEITRVKFM